ncbi:MAG: 2-amino-4-hydroxy-6-hydroxymethyldihydropteridine diphosphokinase [Endomicrobia bacterium]|nr:2-amino-4-hydroxy-6-hydroxymethyldihydropteridine diphosphokinase [Endomicrobiia bacterium]
MPKVYIGIGSNIGDKYRNIISSILKISKIIGKIEKVSSIYLSSPLENYNQPYFYNCVVKVDTKLLPFDLLKELKLIEKNLGRKFSIRKYQPRTIDLDVLLYGGKIINTRVLKIPHEKLHQRKFVLYPLEEIAKNFIHPILNKRITTLKNILHDNNQKISLKIPYYVVLRDIYRVEKNN